jgi:hypothetical protein
LLFDEDEEEYTQRELKGCRMDDWDYLGEDKDMMNSSSGTILRSKDTKDYGKDEYIGLTRGGTDDQTKSIKSDDTPSENNSRILTPNS